MPDMTILDPTGHSKHQWDTENEAEVTAARALFTSLTAKGYQAFNVKRDGEAGTPMRDFDPEAESMILTPQLKGG